MKTIILLFIISSVLVTLVTLDQYVIAIQDTELKQSHWIQECKPAGPNQGVPAIGLYNNTHGFDLLTCTWYLTDNGTPGFIESLYISFVEPFFADLSSLLFIQYAYA